MITPERLQEIKHFDQVGSKIASRTAVDELLAEIDRLMRELEEQKAMNKSGADWAFDEMKRLKAENLSLSQQLQQEIKKVTEADMKWFDAKAENAKLREELEIAKLCPGRKFNDHGACWSCGRPASEHKALQSKMR